MESSSSNQERMQTAYDRSLWRPLGETYVSSSERFSADDDQEIII